MLPKEPTWAREGDCKRDSLATDGWMEVVVMDSSM